MNFYINYRFYYFGTKMSFLISLNSSYHALKFIDKNLDIYKSRIEENLLVPFSKVFARREALLLAMQYYTCINKIG